MLRNFKWYRKHKGGKWWYVKSYDSLYEPSYFWFHKSECEEFPEFDGLFMDNMSTAYWDSWFSFERGYSFYGWKDMEENPTEDWC